MTRSFLKFAIAGVVLVLSLALTFSLVVAWGLRSNWISNKWFQNIAQKTYQKGGLQFSYYRDWRVVESGPQAPSERLEVREGVLMRVVQNHAPTINVEGPDGATMTFALCDPSYAENLNTYADRMRTELTGAFGTDLADAGPLERAACPIHGTNYIGFRYHFAVRPSGGKMSSYYQYFYLLRSPTYKVLFCMQLPEQYVDSPDVNFILNSIKLENEIDPASPMDYHLVDFENLEESLNAGKAIAQHASGEDLAVAQAWNQTLADFIAAKQPFDEARSNFESADILNIHTVNMTRDPGAFEDQFVERRRIANVYWNAAGDWQTRLGKFQTAYDEHLQAFNVVDDRRGSELDELAAETNRLAALRAAYSADEELGLECNYAVSALEVFCSNHDTNYLKRELVKVVALERKDAQIHGLPSPSRTSASLELAVIDPATAATIAAADPNAGTPATATHAPVGNKVGMILYKPNDAVAVIGNHTVGIGDMVDGFRVTAINSDSVTIQSAAGVKTALHLGDVLR